MENIAISNLMKLINALSLENKLELLSKLSESLKMELKPKGDGKEHLLHELCGAWSEMEENLSDEIINSRTISDKDINF